MQQLVPACRSQLLKGTVRLHPMGGDGVEPPETEATSFTDWPATPTV